MEPSLTTSRGCKDHLGSKPMEKLPVKQQKEQKDQKDQKDKIEEDVVYTAKDESGSLAGHPLKTSKKRKRKKNSYRSMMDDILKSSKTDQDKGKEHVLKIQSVTGAGQFQKLDKI